MSSAYRINRKATDGDIVRLNSVGLSLATIANVLGCHPTTVTLRLKSLGVDASDTRRTFMEDVFLQLSLDQREWLADLLEKENISVKTLVRRLLIDKYTHHGKIS